jgi:CDP-diacylglycerol--glycerol-3-phosphate 3-phosphatidyltransferase
VEQQTLSQSIFEKGKVFTFSNLLSLIRLFGAFYLYHVAAQRDLVLALLVTLLLITTDFADGFFARKLNQVSEMGKILDPLADKFCAALGMLALYQFYGLPLWITVVIIGRDILIVLGSLILMSRLPYVTPSAMPGKIAVTILSFLFLVYISGYEPLKVPLQILTFLALLVSAAHYGYNFLQKFRKEKITEGKNL